MDTATTLRANEVAIASSVKAHTPVKSPARIFSPQSFIKQYESTWQVRGYADTTALKNQILKSTSLYFITANALQYSQKIYTRIAALM